MDSAAHPLDEIERQDSNRQWNVCGRSIPRAEIVFFSQVIIVYVVICISLANLSLEKGDSQLWTSLLSTCIGILLPSPTIRRK